MDIVESRVRGEIVPTGFAPDTVADIPFNYRYFVDLAVRHGGRVLDYGCGRGQIVALGIARGLDIWGADPFEGYYETWASAAEPAARGRLKRIVDGRALYPDKHFDLVISNQVIEHVADLDKMLFDVSRLLAPGGTFIAAFPAAQTWYEGHVGLYFAHWFKPGPIRRVYFSLCHRLGLGLYRNGLTRAEWVKTSEATLDDACIYRDRRHLMASIAAAFRSPPADISAGYMRARLGRKLTYAPDTLLRIIFHKRAGEIISVRRR